MPVLTDPVSTTQHAPKGPSMWVPFASLILGGVAVHVAGKQPDILYFDLVFGVWITYQVLWRGFFPSFSSSIARIGIFCVLSGLLSTMVNYHDMFRGIAAVKALAVGVLVYAFARRAPLGWLPPALFGACASILLLRNYLSIRYEVYGRVKDDIGIAMGRGNYVATILILLIPFAVGGACSHKGIKRWVFIACAMLMCAGLLATMSRGGILAIVGATILSVPFLRKAGMNIKHGLAALILLCVAVAMVPVDLLETDVAFFVYRWENPDYGRQEIMKAAWEAFTENPVLGVGPGQLGDAIDHHLIVPAADTGQYNGHNLIIDSLAEMGLPTGLALLAMVGIVLRRAWVSVVTHASAFNVAVWIALLASVMHNMVEASFEAPQFQVVFWSVAAMAGSKSVAHGTIATPGPEWLTRFGGRTDLPASAGE